MKAHFLLAIGMGILGGFFHAEAQDAPVAPPPPPILTDVASFDGLVQKLAEAGTLAEVHHFSAHALLNDPAFQKEIFTELERAVPKELAAALKSAGNMHNPKIVALLGAFPKAVLATPTLRKYNATLAAHHLQITQVDTEKLRIEKAENGDRRFGSALWFVLGPAPDGGKNGGKIRGR